MKIGKKGALTLILIIAFLLSTNVVTYAAIVGQQLPSPESGWKRIDDTNSSFQFTGKNERFSGSSTYLGTGTRVGNGAAGSVRFKFYGTKLRLISSTNNQFDYSKNVEVKIDENVIGSFSAFGPLTYNLLVFEKTNLSQGIHTVEITPIDTTAFGMVFDAIDIEETGYLVNPALVQPELTAALDNSNVSLSWKAIAGAASYNVKRSTTIGGTYTTLANTQGTNYSDSSVTNGTIYYYVVTAVNTAGESEPSNEVSAIPQNSTVTLEVTSVDKARVGDEITANVVIHNATNICAEDLKLVYDTTKLEFVSAENADGMKIYKEDDLGNGIRRYITASLGKTNTANGDKILLTLKFKAKAIGEAKIDITNGRIADNVTLEKDIEEKDCGEKTILIEAGDVNRTGGFTLLDLGIDAWYYGDAVSNTDNTKYDTDVVANGIIDDADLKEIVKQMLNNKNYPVSNNG